MSPREAAYVAALASAREETFAADSLERWQRRDSPSSKDLNLAREIAFGTVRMTLALDHLAKQLLPNQKLPAKLKEKILLRMALYQHHYMDRVPLYAIVDESVTLAKKHCHSSFGNFLNATLRKLPQATLVLPAGDTLTELSLRTSHPTYFIEQLLQNYSLEQTKAILEAGNTPGVTMLRLRPNASEALKSLKGLSPFPDGPASIRLVEDTSLVPQLGSSSECYLQNATPAALIEQLAKQISAPPSSILDLCAAPGGKTIAIHDLFPQAALHANDLSEDKLARLTENFSKYGLQVNLTQARGESLASQQKFDLIIIDAPCSNSGVLNKRVDARWRLNPTNLAALNTTQMSLIEHSLTLLSPTGQLWYLTCSVLKEENEFVVNEACQRFGLQKIGHDQIQLPHVNGWDGGFGCALSRNLSLKSS